jgi:excisionase family DNA binding protein
MDTSTRDQIKTGEPMFLTVADLAELLQVSEKSIARWAAQDASMPAVRLGKLLRFERQAVLDWLRSRTQGRRKRA